MNNHFFSDDIRDAIDKMAIGTEVSIKILSAMLAVKKEHYRAAGIRISTIIQEKVRLGSLKKVGFGQYEKIKTAETEKKINRPCRSKKPKMTDGKSEAVVIDNKLIIYRGTIYPNKAEFMKYYDVSMSCLIRCIYDGYYKNYCIFATKNTGYAMYYAKNFEHALKIKTNDKGCSVGSVGNRNSLS